jgi:hypothetical protein
MTLNTTMELTRGELGILVKSAIAELQHWESVAADCNDNGWRDAKEKDRVLTYQHQTLQLVEKLQHAIKEMDNGSAT